MIEDAELLRRYAEEKSEEAFAELVRRRIGLVYSVALRHTHDAHRAEEVTQTVFNALARKASALAKRPVLVGWLYRSAQFAASDAVRAERRRQAREREAHTMQEITQAGTEPDWEKLQPVLDEVLSALDERDRDAVLLRFFDGQPFAEIGRKLQLTENTARMRVERALDKLHAQLARRGVTSTTAALRLALANQVTTAAPAGLAASVAGTALAGPLAAAGGAILFMSISKLNLGIIIGALVVASGTTLLWQRRTNGGQQSELRAEVARLRQQGEALRRELGESAALRNENAQLPLKVANLQATDEKSAAPSTATGTVLAQNAGVNPPGAKNRDAWRNVGRSTPAETYETVMWACDRGELDVLVKAFVLSDSQRSQAETIFQRLPAASRAEYGTPEKMMALLFALGTPAAIQPISEVVKGPDDIVVRARVWNDRGEANVLELPFRRHPDGWRVVFPEWQMNKSLAKLK